MKKAIAVLLALVLCLSMTAAAFAEEVSIDVINWEDVEGLIADQGIEGTFYALDEIGLIYWVPNAMSPVEAPEDENTYLGFFLTEDGSDGMGITINVGDGSVDFDGFLAAMQASEDAGVSDVGVGVVNGLACIIYTVTIEDAPVSHCLSIILDDGSALSFICSGADEAFEVITAYIFASIQVAE